MSVVMMLPLRLLSGNFGVKLIWLLAWLLQRLRILSMLLISSKTMTWVVIIVITPLGATRGLPLLSQAQEIAKLQFTALRHIVRLSM